MFVKETITIDGPKDEIWSVITDFENAPQNVSGIDTVEILEKPESGLVGLKWRETRTLFGKSAIEDMWITEATENEFYAARAESHGSVYESTMRITESGGRSSLTMTHEGRPQSLVAKILSPPMSLMFKGSMKKAIRQDLVDIKAVVEKGSAR